MLSRARPTRKTGPAVHRLVALLIAFGALVVGAGAAAATPARPSGPSRPSAPVPIATISPELANLPIDGPDYRAAQSRFDSAASALATATALAQSTTADLARLHADDARLSQLVMSETATKKDATIALAQTRTGLRALAIDSYVHGQDEAASASDVNAATTASGHQAIRQAISDAQIIRQRDATVAFTHAVDALRNDLESRVATRAELFTTQAAHDQAVADTARDTDTLAQRQVELDRSRVTATVVGQDYALVALDAYWRAANAMVADDPKCGIPWWALAGIARVESKHGTYGGAQILANGDEDRLIIGIPLDGTDNTQQIADTDGGQYDGDPNFDHAVGPMQFIPSTWRRWARDRNASPNNIYDATWSAAHYLCSGGPMQTDDQLRRGFLRYNQSDAYADEVLSVAKAYARFPIPSAQ
ncbi:MAG TPA: hypothetical protein VGZ52_04095 [Acidimicrobiales bacterium]|nr:hypothetical protein [Acidimicrobiales bacterium]